MAERLSEQKLKDIEHFCGKYVEYKWLHGHIEALEAEIEQLKQLSNPAPVLIAIPQEVADAIQQYSLIRGVNKYGVLLKIERSSNQLAHKARIILKKEYGRDWEEVLMNALINGYIIGKTKEERLRDGISEIYNNFDISNEEIINRLTDFVIKFNTEKEGGF